MILRPALMMKGRIMVLLVREEKKGTVMKMWPTATKLVRAAIASLMRTLECPINAVEAIHVLQRSIQEHEFLVPTILVL
jgi:hypothetical protein